LLAELIKLKTSDGIENFGAVYPARAPQRRFGVVLVHGYTGRFVGEVESALPPRLAEAGYTTLVFNNRGNGILGAATERFAGCLPDIRAALDEMSERGFRRIVLLGHSKGGVKVTYYLAETGDSRIVALGLLSPAAGVKDVAEMAARAMGVSQRQVPERAAELVEKGKGGMLFCTTEWPYLFSAGMIADHMKHADTDVLARLPEVRVPVLATCGGMELDWCVVVRKLQDSPPQGYTVEVILGADHLYTNKEAELAESVLTWLENLEGV
jgi:pimeloyl-ACP methyl ester carboxylesterase